MTENHVELLVDGHRILPILLEDDGSTNLNYRSLENDMDFELVVLVDDEPFARRILAEVRDVDVERSLEIGKDDLSGSIAALRKRVRDPRTMLLLSRRML